ncbi:hypothetical protein DF036_26240 [Burkholderia contaminans]|nr:hypothetical protein DF036_26240 [Burkholderia contaminans]
MLNDSIRVPEASVPIARALDCQTRPAHPCRAARRIKRRWPEGEKTTPGHGFPASAGHHDRCPAPPVNRCCADDVRTGNPRPPPHRSPNAHCPSPTP